MLFQPRPILIALLFAFGSLQIATAQAWIKSTAPTNLLWSSVTASADGSNCVAGAVRITMPIYASTDGGTKWELTPAPLGAWFSIASSYDGRKLVAASSDPRFIYTSTDAGVTWISNSVPLGSWIGVASSADGQKLVAVNNSPRAIYLSSNGGTNWFPATNAPLHNWISIASSADGTKLLAVNSFPGTVFTSTNSGINWTQCSGIPSTIWVGAASSADGNNLLIVSTALSFRSTNAGASWIQNTTPITGLTACASSADGATLIVGGGGGVFTSTDSGTSWTTNSPTTAGWEAFASSADGSKLLATGDKGIWISQTIPTPTLRATRSSANIRLSWIIPALPFVLQSSPDFTPESWTDVPNAPTLNLNTLEHEVTLPISPGMNFFRLRSSEQF